MEEVGGLQERILYLRVRVFRKLNHNRPSKKYVRIQTTVDTAYMMVYVHIHVHVGGAC